MIKILLTFIAIQAIIMVSIEGFRGMKRLERWSLVKNAAYAGLISVITLIIMIAIVIIF